MTSGRAERSGTYSGILRSLSHFSKRQYCNQQRKRDQVDQNYKRSGQCYAAPLHVLGRHEYHPELLHRVEKRQRDVRCN